MGKLKLFLKKILKFLISHLLQIQSPDFHPDRPPPLPPNPSMRGRENSLSNPAPPLPISSLSAPHLKQLERLAKLWVPQLPMAQYQSPGLTSGPVVNPKPDPTLILYPSPGRGSPHRWQESRLWKLWCWQDLQFQSPGLFIFLVLMSGEYNDTLLGQILHAPNPKN